MNRVERHIPKIIELLSKNGNKLPKVYNSYIASFSTSVAMNGLVATIALYEDMNKVKENKTKGDKSFIPQIILDVLKSYKQINENSLLKYVLKNDEKKLKREILDIAIAFKLAIRTFELED